MKPFQMTRLAALVPVLVAALPAPAAAEEAPTLNGCAQIAQSQDRLACYDRLAGRAPAAPPANATLLEQKPPPPPTAPPTEVSLLSRYWELDPADKRGVFDVTGYRPNYVLPVHYTSRINTSPQSPTQAPVDEPSYRHLESKFQLSLRTKVAQDFGLPNADLWLAFTQQVVWQVWNSEDSKPFRNSDYEPEAIYVVPTGPGLRSLPLGWNWRYTQLGLAHQSNGQSDPLSRSWNRVYLGVGLENGPWSVTARAVQRLHEKADRDNNPDLERYRGRTELGLNWAAGRGTAALLYRGNPGGPYGSVQFDLTYPVFASQPNGLRWYVQLFHGYAETLTDYNFRQTSFGAGVSFLQF